MKDERSWRRHFRFGRSVREEIEEEVAFHLETQRRALIASGMTEAEAAAEADRMFGDRARVERSMLAIDRGRERTERRSELWAGLRQDLRIAARSLARQPGFAAVTALTLALGIGATVAIFAVVNAVLIQPLPFPESERIVVVNHHAPGLMDLEGLGNSTGTIRLYREAAEGFSSVAALRRGFRTVTGAERAERIRVLEASPEIFDVLGVGAAIGRGFAAEDQARGAPTVGVLTHAGWTTFFARAPDVLGRVISVDGSPVEVIGVMPRGFTYLDPEIVLLLPRAAGGPDEAGASFGITGIARLAPGVSLDAARAEVAALQERMPEVLAGWCDTACTALPRAVVERARGRSSVTPLRDDVVGDVEAALWIVLTTVSMVLLIACANVANLFLVRAEGRQREVAVRGALGAGRWRVASGFLSESLLIGLAGGAAGTFLAWTAVTAITRAGPPQIPRLHEVGIDGATLLFAAGVTLLSALLFGAIPLPRLLMGHDFAGTMREGRGDTASRGRHRTRGGLITAQVALAVVLLTGAGLMLRSFQQLGAVPTGIEVEGVLTVGVSSVDTDPASAAAFYQAIVREVRGAPGVTMAGAATSLPIAVGSFQGSSLTIESRPPPDEREPPPSAMYVHVTDGFLETLGIPLLGGRALAAGDLRPTPRHVWVNDAFRSRLLDGRALGERIRFGSDTTWLEVAGVVGDVRWFGLKEEVRPMAFLPMRTSGERGDLPFVQLVVRSSGEPGAAFPGVRSAIDRIAPTVPLATPRTMRQIVDASRAATAFTMSVLIVAALVALALGAIGLYGVISYIISQRTREIGVRIALGAHARDVTSLMLSRGLVVVGAGLAIGLASALALTGLMRGILFETSARDPLTFVVVPTLLLLVSLLAIWLPARRAARISPLEALRAE